VIICHEKREFVYERNGLRDLIVKISKPEDESQANVEK